MADTTIVKTKLVCGTLRTPNGEYRPFIGYKAVTTMPTFRTATGDPMDVQGPVQSIDTHTIWEGPPHTEEFDAYLAAEDRLMDRLKLLFNSELEET